MVLRILCCMSPYIVDPGHIVKTSSATCVVYVLRLNKSFGVKPERSHTVCILYLYVVDFVDVVSFISACSPCMVVSFSDFNCMLVCDCFLSLSFTISLVFLSRTFFHCYRSHWH